MRINSEKKLGQLDSFWPLKQLPPYGFRISIEIQTLLFYDVLNYLTLDEAFSSQSANRRVATPQIVDRRTSSRGPIPRVYTTTDYRIRHKFPDSKYASAVRQMPKSHTINSFTEVRLS